MSTLEGKIAVISGGTEGIGLATAQRFVAEGAYVFLFGRRQAKLDEAVKRIGRNVTAIKADASDLDDLDRVAATVAAEKGVVDIVVSNAGLTEQASIDTLTPEHFDKTFNLMARGPVFMVQAPAADDARGIGHSGFLGHAWHGYSWPYRLCGDQGGGAVLCPNLGC